MNIFAANMAVERMFAVLEQFLERIMSFGINIIIALIIFFVGSKIVMKWLLKLINQIFEKGHMEISVRKFLVSLIRTVLYGILLIIICNKVGIETTSFIAVLGSAGLAVGLSMQGSLSNFAGGVLILLIKPFVVGDYIIDGGSGQEGKVSRIDLFYTHLTTNDNRMVVIPNGTLANSHLINNTAFETRRVDMKFGIAYDNDVKLAKALLEQEARSHKLVLEDKDVDVFIADLEESQVTIALRVWVKKEDYWTVRAELIEQVKERFDENGVQIPFQQMDIHLVESVGKEKQEQHNHVLL